MRAFLFVLFAACGMTSLSLPCAAANAFTADVSDIWWNPNESGWGVNLVEQSNILFASFFVYSPDGRAHWYSASLASTGSPSDSSQTFRGDLWETSGPVVLTAPFDPGLVSRRRVGDATVQYTPPNSVALTYSVDGATTAKTLQRVTWAVNDISGGFDGVIRAIASPACGRLMGIDYLGQMSVSQSGSTATIHTFHGSPSILDCTYSGTLSQTGRFGAISGSYSCTGGSTPPALSGTFTMSEIEVGKHGFQAKLLINDGGCVWTGHFGGTRDSAP